MVVRTGPVDGWWWVFFIYHLLCLLDKVAKETTAPGRGAGLVGLRGVLEPATFADQSLGRFPDGRRTLRKEGGQWGVSHLRAAGQLVRGRTVLDHLGTFVRTAGRVLLFSVFLEDADMPRLGVLLDTKRADTGRMPVSTRVLGVVRGRVVGRDELVRLADR
jgi:hypothetical protein